MNLATLYLTSNNGYSILETLLAVGNAIPIYYSLINIVAEWNYLSNISFNQTENYIMQQETDMVKEAWYGFWKIGNNGCGIIAVYNALKKIDELTESSLATSVRDLSYYFIENGAILLGAFGTFPLSISSYLSSRLGIMGGSAFMNVKTATNNFDDLFNGYRLGIFSFWWNINNIAEGAHTIFLYKVGGNNTTSFAALNIGTGYEIYNSFAAFENYYLTQRNKQIVPISLICISVPGV